jgi:hypothetical protein
MTISTLLHTMIRNGYSAIVIPFPMPLVPPVINAVLPFRLKSEDKYDSIMKLDQNFVGNNKVPGGIRSKWNFMHKIYIFLKH